MFSHGRRWCRWLWGNGSSPAGQVEREAKEESLVRRVGSGRIKSRPGSQVHDTVPLANSRTTFLLPTTCQTKRGADRLGSARSAATRSTTGKRHWRWVVFFWFFWQAVTAADGVREKALLSQGWKLSALDAYVCLRSGLAGWIP